MCKEALFLVMATVISLSAADKEAQKAQVVSQTFRPGKRDFTDQHLQQLKLPPGFKIGVFAKGQGNARMLLTLPDGTVLLSRMQEGDVVALRDENGDGAADAPEAVAKIKEVHGLAFRDKTVYLASTTKLFAAPLGEKGQLGPPREFATLPDGGQHPRRTMGFDDAGLLYVSIGSTCNNCHESNPEHATMVRMKPDGTDRKVFASGLRNTIGFDWHPETRALWGMDHGSDDRGNDVPPEELNLIQEGKHYGWPLCFGKGEIDKIAHVKPGMNPEEFCAKSTPMALGYQAHAAPIAFVFYNGSQFPPEFKGDAFTALHGSWNRDPAVGYSVVRVRFNNGQPVAFEDFVSGWLIEGGKAFFGRPAGLAVAKDGALLISDDVNGVIYRVSKN